MASAALKKLPAEFSCTRDERRVPKSGVRDYRGTIEVGVVDFNLGRRRSTSSATHFRAANLDESYDFSKQTVSATVPQGEVGGFTTEENELSPVLYPRYVLRMAQAGVLLFALGGVLGVVSLFPRFADLQYAALAILSVGGLLAYACIREAEEEDEGEATSAPQGRPRVRA